METDRVCTKSGWCIYSNYTPLTEILRMIKKYLDSGPALSASIRKGI